MFKIPGFFTHMDKRALRAILVLMAMFAVVIAILAFGRSSMNLQDGEYLRWFAAFSNSPLALLIVVMTFVAAAFLGVPQWMLIAGSVFAFGPMLGSIYAWGATLISASVNFWLGRWIGAERLREYGGDLINRIINVVRKNGFVTSFAVRLVPTGPFVLVNMAAGVSRMTFPAFFSGTALGIIPKILVVGLLGQGVLSGQHGWKFGLGFAGLAVLFIIVMLVARRRLTPMTASAQETPKITEESNN